MVPTGVDLHSIHRGHVTDNKRAAKDAAILVGMLIYVIGGLLAMIPIGMWVQCRYGGTASIIAAVVYLIVWAWTAAFVAFR